MSASRAQRGERTILRKERLASLQLKLGAQVHHTYKAVQNCPRAERSEASEAYADTNGCEAPITMLVPGFSYNSISLLTGTQTLRN